MILILGPAHSHTSAIAKFLYDNGVEFTEIVSNWNPDLPYDKYEDRDVLKWVKEKKKFKNPPFPIKNGAAKAPDAVYFDIPKEVKIVFCMRHISDLIVSNNEKNKWGFMRTFNKAQYAHKRMLTCKNEVYFVPTERILSGNISEGVRLLAYCGISTPSPKFDLLDIKPKPKYLPHRIENTLWRILHVFIRKPNKKYDN